MMPDKPWLKFYGTVPATLEYPESSIYGFLREEITVRPLLPGLVFMGKTISKGSFLERIDHMSRAFAAVGVAKGSRVILCLPNIPQAVIAFYALSRLGAIPAPIHPLSSSPEILGYARLVDADTAICLDGFFPRFAPILSESSILRTIVCSVGSELSGLLALGYTLTEGRKIEKIVYSSTVLDWTILEHRENDFPELIDPDPLSADELGLILFSGGSTGIAKAIMLSNRNVNALAIQTNAAGGPIGPGQAMLSILPLFHGFGLAVGIHAILTHGGQCILVPRFKADSLVGLIKRYKPAYMAGVPTLYDALAANKNFAKLDLSGFRGIFCGGDSLSPGIKHRFEEVLRAGGCMAELREGYGLTESVTANILMPTGAYRERSMGIPYPDMLAKIVTPGTREELPPNMEGELCVSGPTVMLGYLNNQEATDTVLKLHPDGLIWLHTDDICLMDEDGFFYFKQRAKRIIKSSGIAVYPSQVEDVLAKHPAVRLACVIGIPHPTQVEVPKGFVTLKEGYVPSPELEKELIEHCRGHLIPHSCPRCIEFLSEMPKTRVGKVAFRELEARESGTIAD